MSRRNMRAQQAWKVDTHTSAASAPASLAMRSAISLAALLVKVMARIFHGGTPSSISLATR